MVYDESRELVVLNGGQHRTSDALLVRTYGSTDFRGRHRRVFPASVTSCLTSVAVIDVTTLRLTDACSGMLIELRRQ